MTSGRRRVQALRNIVGFDSNSGDKNASTQSESVQPKRAETPPRAAAAHAAAIENANNSWQFGDKAKAFDILRRARLQYGPSAALQFDYAQKALRQGESWAAREALHDAVDLDPTHLDALEQFINLNRQRPAARGSVTQAFTALAGLLPYAAGFDSDAAAFLLPSVETLEVADQKLRMLRYSDDPVARYIGVIAFEPTQEWNQDGGPEPSELLQAKLIVTLVRGDYTVAFPLLAQTSQEEHPKRALRLAIHKELRLKNDQVARHLLGYYRKLEPNDNWSRQALKSVAKANKYYTELELTSRGFPFPSTTAKTKYEADENKILYMLHNSLPLHSGGYATRTHGLLRGIRAHGWDVQGVTRLGYPHDMPSLELIGPVDPVVEIDDVTYHRLSTTKTLQMKKPIQAYVSRYSKALEKFATKTKPSILHAASNHWNGLTAVTTARRLGIPSIYEVRGLWEVTRGSRDPDWMGGLGYQYTARMEADAASNASRVITITNALRDELVSRGVDDEKITVVPNGVDVSRFIPRARNTELQSKLGLNGKTVIGYVGSLVDYEGLELLIDAAKILKQERADVAVLIVGDGAVLSQLRERVDKENLADIVTFTGRVPHHEVEDYYSIIDICPFPRLPLPVCEMVSPLKPFEAMAMEKAVIASNVAALAEIVTDGFNGILFEKGQVESLAQGLRLLLNDPELRQRLAEAGRRWVKQERDWSTLSQRVGDIYASLGAVKAIV